MKKLFNLNSEKMLTITLMNNFSHCKPPQLKKTDVFSVMKTSSFQLLGRQGGTLCQNVN